MLVVAGSSYFFILSFFFSSLFFFFPCWTAQLQSLSFFLMFPATVSLLLLSFPYTFIHFLFILSFILFPFLPPPPWLYLYLTDCSCILYSLLPSYHPSFNSCFLTHLPIPWCSTPLHPYCLLLFYLFFLCLPYHYPWLSLHLHVLFFSLCYFCRKIHSSLPVMIGI